MRAWPARAAAALTISVAGVMLAACASAAGSGGSGSVSAGSCAAEHPSVYLAWARVVFTGTALPGPTADAGSAGAVLASPARFRVARYLKGGGPSVVTVQTALTVKRNVVIADEEGIEPQAGQRWMIYATSRRMPYQTSDCGGSCLLGWPADDVNIPCGQESQGK